MTRIAFKKYNDKNETQTFVESCLLLRLANLKFVINLGAIRLMDEYEASVKRLETHRKDFNKYVDGGSNE